MRSNIAIFLAVLLVGLFLILWQLDAVEHITISFRNGGYKSRNTSMYDIVFGLMKHRNASISTSENRTGRLLQRSQGISSNTQDVQTVLGGKLRVVKNATTVPLDGNEGSIHGRRFAPILTENVFLLVLITTRPKARSRRDLLRRTWAATRDSKNITGFPGKSSNTSVLYPELNVYCIFVVGFEGDANLDRQIEYESDEYGDILRVNQKESYRNLVEKIQSGFEWAIGIEPKYILKADDDVYVNFPRLLSWLNEPSIPRKLYAGFVHYRAYIHRSKSSSWYVSREDFDESHFPNYCAGPFYIFSGNILRDIHTESLRKKRFQVEDAYFGLLARSIGVSPTNVGGGLWAWEGSMNVKSSKWTDERLKKTAVLGDSLNDKELQYFHERYQKIDQSRL